MQVLTYFLATAVCMCIEPTYRYLHPVFGDLCETISYTTKGKRWIHTISGVPPACIVLVHMDLMHDQYLGLLYSALSLLPTIIERLPFSLSFSMQPVVRQLNLPTIAFFCRWDYWQLLYISQITNIYQSITLSTLGRSFRYLFRCAPKFPRYLFLFPFHIFFKSSLSSGDGGGITLPTSLQLQLG